MTKKYVYFRDIDHPTTESVVYCLMIGDSEREKKLIRVINTYAAAQDAYFEVYSECALMRLILAEESVFGNSKRVCLRFRSALFKASDFVRMLKDGSLDKFEANLTEPPAKIHLMSLLSTDYYMSRKVHRAPAIPASLSRNNLSQRGRKSLIDAAIGFVIVAGLYILQMIIDAIERSVLL